MNLEQKLKSLPTKPGIYLFYHKKELIYAGKATNLKSRVRSYFSGQKTPRPIETFIDEVTRIDYKVTDNALEAIIMEANFIKKYEPKYNVIGKDDKSWNYIVITSDKYPQVIFVRQHEISKYSLLRSKSYEGPWAKKLFRARIFGPYPGVNTKNLFKTLQKMFNISVCKSSAKRACFYNQIGICLGVCTGEISATDYKKKVITSLVQFLRGNKKMLVRNIEKRMKESAKKEDFEEARRLRDQLKGLKRVQDITLINKSFFKFPRIGREVFRVEGYDISNLGDTNMVGSMVVFDQNGPIKSGYRKFRIKTVKGQSDVDSLAEVISRRIKHDEWPMPKVFLVDGGKPQVNKVRSVLKENGINIPVVGIAKGKERKKNEFVYNSVKVKDWVRENEGLLISVRDEAHRFAIKFQRQTRRL
jgi:excinuclease ABC subunit C